MTPDEVLHALRLFAQVSSDSFFGSWAEKFTTETTIADFEAERDSTGFMARDLSWFFYGVHHPQSMAAEVRAHITELEEKIGSILNRDEVRTLGDLCRELCVLVPLAPHEEMRFLDEPCSAGAMFLTLQHELSARGAAVPPSPSTRMRVTGDLLFAVLRIAPSRIPRLEPGRFAWFLGIGNILGCSTLALTLLLGCLGVRVMTGVSFLVGTALSISLLATGVLLLTRNPIGQWPDIRTYRDLCKTLAGEPIARGAMNRNQGANTPRSP
jgi:hypothetical protein